MNRSKSLASNRASFGAPQSSMAKQAPIAKKAATGMDFMVQHTNSLDEYLVVEREKEAR